MGMGWGIGPAETPEKRVVARVARMRVSCMLIEFDCVGRSWVGDGDAISCNRFRRSLVLLKALDVFCVGVAAE